MIRTMAKRMKESQRDLLILFTVYAVFFSGIAVVQILL